MAYILDLSEQAQKDIAFHKISGHKGILKNLSVLLNELTQHPFEETGKLEQFKHNLAAYYGVARALSPYQSRVSPCLLD